MEDGNDPGKSFLGYVVAAQPLGQLISSPILGYLGNRFGSVRYLTMTTMSILCLGFIFYACIHALPPPRKWYLIVARFLVGAAAGIAKNLLRITGNSNVSYDSPEPPKDRWTFR